MQDLARKILDDNGYKSRKFIVLLVYWSLLTLALPAAVVWPTVKELFVSYWTGLSAGLATYYGVQWGHSYLASNLPAPAPGTPDDDSGSAKVPGDATP